MKTLLYLDDHRDPMVWLNGDMFMVTHKIYWVQSFDEFVEWIVSNGLPDFISFDHDLGDEHYEDFINAGEQINYETYAEETGYDAAQWLVKYCDEHRLKIPLYRVHSANPTGAENIRSYLRNAIKHLGL